MSDTKKRQTQKKQIIKIITIHGPLSRVDIARMTGITQAITGAIVNDLIATNIVHVVGETGPTVPGSGRPRILLAAVGKREFFIGSELSERFLTFSLVDNIGQIFKQTSIRIDKTTFNQQLTGTFYYQQLQTFINICQNYHPRAVGIALPGHFDAEAQQIVSNNPLWLSFDLTLILNKIDLPIYLENNVHCMAIRERLFNDAHHDMNFIFFHVGRGLFCSSMNQGQIYGANNFLVGEIGHNIMSPNGEYCECGRRGCLQTYASEGWLIKKTQLLYQKLPQSYLHQLVDNVADVTIEVVLQAYEIGDEGVINILDHAMQYLAQAVSNISTLLDSQQIILHGQIFVQPGLVALLRQYIQQNQFLINRTAIQPVILKPYQTCDGSDAAATMASLQY
ncbi:ROK family protein [Latilactobacillus fuchuensis]|uniref:Xylose repressor protein n=1 Tax=Latilactobacillus fuchuensis DSM 14340 = JCM 11249 TaxID=1423747 RepID=A0A0R1RRB4_9LACO|nr:ROK family protein [Latilactobacillus fuchuensis]KRL59532.1 Xylose repressor protein [Latilactobacillus fuchuensis DSM 14340 = JCM 11249]